MCCTAEPGAFSAREPHSRLNQGLRPADARGVTAAPDRIKDETQDTRPAVLPRLGEAIPPIVQRFNSKGTLGVVLLDTSPLARIERSYGYDAYARAVSSLGGLVRDAADEVLDGDELIVSGETGRHEIVIMLFRDKCDGQFYRSELPGLIRALQRAIERRGHRVVYPYFRKVPILGIGFSAALRNPHFGAETQLREALEEARDDAGLSARREVRQRRKSFLGMVMAGEVSSVYEPIVDVATKTVFGYEALARGPAGTEFHSPDALFAAAEEEAFIFELDCLCRKSGLDGAIGLPSDTKLFLNVRPTTIHDPSFRPEALIRTLEKSRLRPSDVVFEISEKESIANFEIFKEIRDEYRKLGFRFALDDTGAGYASLQAVIELEPDFIKVDRALITGVDTDRARQALLKALHALSGGIGAKLIAEGLNTLEELETLGELEIPFGQGWLFGKPTPLRAEE
jgi:EAL domain-containing protein (putative c-di-GMP-specific phosphodiesterase class I)